MKSLVQGLVQRGNLKNPLAAKSLAAVDRKYFVIDEFSELAHIDRPLPTGNHGQTISAPHMHAYALDVLAEKLKPGAHVLDVGSGSGYMCAVFADMMDGKGQVVGVELLPELVKWSKNNLKRIPIMAKHLDQGMIEIDAGNGWEGNLKHAPYDAIHVGAAAKSLPQALVDQLKPGGKMLIPVDDADAGHSWMTIVEKGEDGIISQKRTLAVNYVPLIDRPVEESVLELVNPPK